jgi:hypothetical protein
MEQGVEAATVSKRDTRPFFSSQHPAVGEKNLRYKLPVK